MYKIVLTKRAIKDIEKIEINTKMDIGNKLRTLIDDPLKVSKKLSNPIIGTYRFRIGDYRVIFDLGKDEVIILRVGHRRDIYK